MTGTELIAWLLLGYGLASATVDTTPPAITDVKICAEHDYECKKDWPK